MRPNRRRLAPWAGALVATLLVGCGDSEREPTPAPTASVDATTTSAPAPTTTSAQPAPTTTAPAPATATTAPRAENAARALYDAWARGERGAAGAVAEPAAVTTLFARPWRAGDGWAFAECTGAAGSLVCTWRGAGGQQLLMRVQNAPSMVAEVRFQP